MTTLSTFRLALVSALLAFLAGATFVPTNKANAQTISFNVGVLQGTDSTRPTTLQFGPDGRLYVGQKVGTIRAYTVVRNDTSDFVVTDIEIITGVRSVTNHDDSTGVLNSVETNRQLTGLVVTGDSLNPVIYASSSDPRVGGNGGATDTDLDTNSGVVTKLTWNGTSWDKIDLVRGLPRSEENHASNGLELSVTGDTLFLAQGGHTNAGAPSNNFAFITEYALAAAILSIDLVAIEAMPTLTDAQGDDYKYDLPTLDDPTRANANGIDDPLDPAYDGIDINDPFGGNDGLNQAKIVPGGPVQVHSPGWRNPYDVVIQRTPGREGRMYAIDNGANPGWGGHPDGEGPAGTCTQDYDPLEPGSTGPGPNDDKVNNLDNLHFITSEGYYAGHATPVRGNPFGAGLYTFDTSGFFRTDPADLPPDWPPVSVANPVECDFRNPGVDDGALWTNPASTNGLTEYPDTSFSGVMQGNLLTVGFDGHLWRLELSAAGDVVTNATKLASNFGDTPLDVIAMGEGDPYPGSIWVASFISNEVHIFEPNRGATCSAVYSDLIDDDADNFHNADEIDNGTDPCSAASAPADHDGDFLSDLNDDDDDEDGILDVSDLFALDFDNGLATDVPLNYPLLNEDPGTGFFGLGFTGLMSNGTDYLDLYEFQNLIPGGTSGLFTIVDVTEGDATGTTNTGETGFQFGVDVKTSTGSFTVRSRISSPWFNSVTPTDDQSMGMFIGTGDQSDYMKISLHAHGGNGGIQVVLEEADVVISTDMYADDLTGGNLIPDDVLLSDYIDLYLAVDPNAGTVQPQYSAEGGSGVVNLGSPITLTPGSGLRSAIESGTTAMAVGVISSSVNSGATFTATWDDIEITTEATLVAAPTSVDHGQLGLGVTDSQVVTFTNTGGMGDITVSAVSLTGDADFVLNPTPTVPTVIGPGGTMDITVDFTPATTGVKNATLDVTHDGANVSPLAVAFTGEGISGASTLAATPDTLDFGLVNNGTPVSDIVTLSNTLGTDDITITDITLVGAAEFTLNLGFTLPTTLTPGQTVDVDIDFESLSDGVYSATLDVTHDGSNASPLTVPVNGEGTTPGSEVLYRVNAGGGNIVDATLDWDRDTKNVPSPYNNADIGDNKTGSVNPYPGVNNTLAPDDVFEKWRFDGAGGLNLEWDFPAATVGTYEIRLFFGEGTASNQVVGNRVFDVNIEGATVLDDYDVYADVGLDAVMKSFLVTISDGNIDIDFIPIADDPFVSAIEIIGGASGASTLAATPDPLDFGQVVETTTASSVVTLSNTLGTDPIDITAISIVGDPDFALNLGFTLPHTLNAGETVDVNIDFTPADIAVKSATLDVTHDGLNASPLIVGLDGEGIDGASTLAAAPSPLDIGQVLIATTASGAVKLTNTVGIDDIIISDITLTGDADFALNLGFTLPYTLTAGDSVDVDIDFTPATEGAKATTLDVTHDGVNASPLAVAVSGEGIDGSSTLDASPTPLEMGSVTLNNTLPGVISLTNTVGVNDIIISDVTLTGDADFALNLAFTVPLTLTPGESVNVDIDFTPAAVGAKTATLDVTHDGSNASPLSVTVNGTGTEGVPEPLFRVNPGGALIADATLDWSTDTKNEPSIYNNAATGDNSTAKKIPFAGVNTTGAPDSAFDKWRKDPVGGTNLEWDFPTTIAGTYEVRLYFAEGNLANQSVGARVFDVTVEGSLVLDDYDAYSEAGIDAVMKSFFVTVNDGNLDIDFGRVVGDPFVSAVEILGDTSGPGTLSAAPDPLDFGPVVQATTSSDVVWLYNTDGTESIDISAISIVGDADFATNLGITLPYTLVSGDSVAVDIDFTPATLGAKTATLEVTHDGVNASPLTVALDGEGVDGSSTLVAAPSPFDMGSVLLGGSTSGVVTLTNTIGVDDIIISDVVLTGDADFTLNLAFTVPHTLTPGASVDVDMDFAPATAGAKSATLDVTHDGGNVSPLAVAVSGTGTESAPVALFRVNPGGGNVADGVLDWDRDTKNVPSPYNNAATGDNKTGKVIPYPGVNTTSAPDVVFEKWRYDLAGGTDLLWDFPLEVPGTYEVRLFFAESEAVNQSVGARVFDVTMEGTVVLDDYDVWAEMGSADAVMKSFMVTVNDGNLDIDFGRVADDPFIHAIEILGDDPGAASLLTTSADTLDFGPVINATTASDLFTLTNTGTVDDIILSDITITGDADFALNVGFTLPYTLTPGATVDVDVDFTPASTGAKSATLDVTHDGSNASPLSVALLGEGSDGSSTLTAAPSPLDLGIVVAGSTQSGVVTLTNTIGTDDIVLSAIALTGDPEFALNLAFTLPYTLTPGATVDVDVDYSPTADAANSTSLDITHDGGNPSPLSVAISGTGTTNDAGEWEILVSNGLPKQRHESGYAAVGDTFYLLGGRGTRKTYSYNVTTDTWTKLGATPPTELHHFQAVTYDSKIYVVGAYTGDFPNETPVMNIYIYDPVTNAWTMGAEIPQSRQRGSTAAAVYNGKIYMVGGSLGGHGDDSVMQLWFDEFDPVTEVWTTLPDPPRGRDHAEVAVVGDALYFVGGSTGSTAETVAEVDKYDFITGQWSTVANNLPTPRTDLMVAVIGNEVIAIGGESDALEDAHGETEALDVTTGTWRSLAMMVDSRHGTQAITYNDKIYVASGSGEKGGGPELTNQERFQFLAGPPASVQAISSVVTQEAELAVSADVTLRLSDATGASRKLFLAEEEDRLVRRELFRIDSEPTAGIFDARFEDDTRFAIGNEARIEVQPAARPVTIQVESMPDEVEYVIEQHADGELVATHSVKQGALLRIFDQAADAFVIRAVVEEAVEEIPTTFELEQNYPNPFARRTTIRYQLAEPADVELTVYNMLGQVVARLVDQRQEAGRYEVPWDTMQGPSGQLASGVYLYQVRAGSFTETRKMLLVK